MSIAEPGQLGHRGIDRFRCRAALLVAEEPGDHEIGFVLRPHSGAHWGPQVVHGPPRDAPCLGAAPEAQPSLRSIEREMSAFVLDDALEEVDQDRMLGLGDQTVVSAQRGELVERSPCHV